MAVVEFYGDDKDGEIMEVPDPLPPYINMAEAPSREQIFGIDPSPFGPTTKQRTYHLEWVYIQGHIAEKIKGP